MKGIKTGILGICLGLAGLAAASDHFVAMIFASISIVTAIAAFFIKD